jgi:hypothetical protein
MVGRSEIKRREPHNNNEVARWRWVVRTRAHARHENPTSTNEQTSVIVVVSLKADSSGLVRWAKKEGREIFGDGERGEVERKRMIGSGEEEGTGCR